MARTLAHDDAARELFPAGSARRHSPSRCSERRLQRLLEQPLEQLADVGAGLLPVSRFHCEVGKVRVKEGYRAR